MSAVQAFSGASWASPLRAPEPGQMTREAIGELRRIVRSLEDIAGAASARGDGSALKKAQQQLAEARRLIALMDGTRTGARDAAVMLAHQPTARQLALPGHRSVALAKAAARMKKSKTAFMHPGEILGCCAAVMGGLPESEVREAEHRILHFLSEANLARDGRSAASFLSRLGRSGLAAARGNDDSEEVANMRSTLCDFLVDARGRP